MTTETREITEASLRVANDLGHGGSSSRYRLARAGDAYESSVTISRSFPAPGERRFRPRELSVSLDKAGREAAEFLARLAAEHRVFELADLPCPTVFLHPTFYHFHFVDARGESHDFEYSVEAGRHHGDAHRRLVEDFEQFFESERVSRSFYEGAGADETPPEEPARPWWRFR